jgi:quinol-cytochrome oxidoreductase complex cytochrome b subunit
MLVLHLLPPLYRVFTIVYLKQPMFTGLIMLQLVSCVVNGICNAISNDKQFVIIVIIIIIIIINAINIFSIAISSHIV